jgi:hypothetical protein
MSVTGVDISGFLVWEEGLPRLRWELVEECIESRFAADDRAEAWTDIVRQWLAELAAAIDKEDYEVIESDRFLGLDSSRDAVGRPLLRFAEDCVQALIATLPGIADFQTPGKQLIIVPRTSEVYYSYIAPYYPEGEFGGSGGIQIREGIANTAAGRRSAASRCKRRSRWGPDGVGSRFRPVF